MNEGSYRNLKVRACYIYSVEHRWNREDWPSRIFRWVAVIEAILQCLKMAVCAIKFQENVQQGRGGINIVCFNELLLNSEILKRNMSFWNSEDKNNSSIWKVDTQMHFFIYKLEEQRYMMFISQGYHKNSTNKKLKVKKKKGINFYYPLSFSVWQCPVGIIQKELFPCYWLNFWCLLIFMIFSQLKLFKAQICNLPLFPMHTPHSHFSGSSLLRSKQWMLG